MGTAWYGPPSPLWGGVGRGPDCQRKVLVVRKPVSTSHSHESDCTPNLPSNRPFSSLPLQDKQNEASYLRDHKEELTEELATTILQKVGGLAIR